MTRGKKRHRHESSERVQAISNFCISHFVAILGGGQLHAKYTLDFVNCTAFSKLTSRPILVVSIHQVFNSMALR